MPSTDLVILWGKTALNNTEKSTTAKTHHWGLPSVTPGGQSLLPGALVTPSALFTSGRLRSSLLRVRGVGLTFTLVPHCGNESSRGHQGNFRDGF